MPLTSAYRPAPVYEALNAAHAGELADVVKPAAFPKTSLRHRNDRAAASVGVAALDCGEFKEFSDASGLIAHLEGLADKVLAGRETP